MDRALECCNRMVELADELGNAAELSRGRGNRGYALLGLGRYEEALADIDFSLALYREQGRLEGTIVTTIDLVIYLRGVGENERAAELALENYEAAWKEDFPHLHVVTARCLALFRPPAEQEALLRRALALAREHERPMDEAGCLFSIAALATDEGGRSELYQQAVVLLEQMGCTGWLAGKSIDDPPLLPMTI
jgi:tetratricopeptide (TPR) repeat protein